MVRAYTIKDPLSENRIFLGRIVAISIFILLLTLGLLIRLVYLQIAGHKQYASMATDNRIRMEPLPPTRGIIYDRNGKILAENIPSYSLELIPEQIADIDDTLQRLQKLLNISDEKIEQFYKLKKRQKNFTSVPLLIRMNNEDVAKFAVLRPYFPGVDIHARLVRHYPYAELTSHVVGYVGRINEAELKSLPVAEYRGTHHIGKIGIEKTYESALHGTAGFAEIETNAQARPINTLKTHAPVPGSDLHLNLDIALQKTAYNALDKYNGAVVAIDIKTGGVLVFVSRPGYDPNQFVMGISSKAYKALQDSDSQPLFNRALRGQYPPGSTLKPFFGLAGLEHKVTSFHQKLHCPGFFQLPNLSHRYRDWKKWGHGDVNMKAAITQSYDVYFYNLAIALGIDRMHNFLQLFGFGEKSGIDLIGEKAGLVPSRAWKRRNKNAAWYHGETVITGIGQGFTQTTPIQLSRATATLANRGKVVTPVLVDSIVTANTTLPGPKATPSNIPLKTQNVDDIIKAMTNVVHGKRGTAKIINKDINYKIAGKTGTAQVYSVKQEENYNEDEIAFKLRDHALFIAFAPVINPQIAVAVIAEHGSHGSSTAAPIAAKIIKQYLAKDTEE